MRYTFKVNERLKKEQHIDTLFRTGKAFSVFPVRFRYLIVSRAQPTDSPVMAGFSVPKKKFRRSVDRHRIRRLMVESWRLHKHVLYEQIDATKQIHLFLLFTGTEMPEYDTVLQSVIKGIDDLGKLLPK